MNLKLSLLFLMISLCVIPMAFATDKNLEEVWKPSATEFDWIQLTSGEWLKGEIKSMYNESLEFDSDKLKLLNIDLEDVQYLQSFQQTSVNVEGVGSVLGKLNISKNMVSVGEGKDTKKYERLNLVSFASGGASEAD